MSSAATGFRPPGWQKTQKFSITGTLPSSSGGSGSSTTYYFDAILRTEHEDSLTKSQQPIQAGASITDNAYNNPSMLRVEIGMSDSMDSYTAGQWTSASTKSVSAYQTLLQLKEQVVILTIQTKLRTYSNMLVQHIRAIDDFRTRTALRALVTFEEILTGTVTSTPNSVSARPNQNGNSPQGGVLPQPVPPGVQGPLQSATGGGS